MAFRITATECWLYHATPQWVFDEGAIGYDVNIYDDNKLIREPDYDHPVFLEYVEKFVEAMAERYDGNPNVLRIGYRLQLCRLEYPTTVRLGEAFFVRREWRNAGVSPCYAGGYPCLTLKDDKGGIVSVLVDDRLNVNTLPVDEPDKATSSVSTAAFTIAFSYADRRGDFFRTCRPGVYDLFVSVGKIDGTPIYELPYNDSDGRKK